MEENVQLTSHIGRPFISACAFINTHRKCAASAYKRTVVFKWAVIYKQLDPYLSIRSMSLFYDRLNLSCLS